MGYNFIAREDGKRTRALLKRLDEAVGISELLTDESPLSEREIVIGESNRVVTKKAKEALLSAMYEKGGDTVGFAIACEGESFGIYCSDFRAEWAAVDYLLENFPPKDTVRTFSLMPYLKERGEKIKEGAWKRLSGHLGEHGEKISAELQRLYSLFGIENVLWQANLFDPQTGAFYYSNSARDAEGYLPSIEETYDALCLLDVTGMGEMLNISPIKALPEWVKKKMGDFLISTQDEDGFYYNPQWPKEFIAKNKFQSRITRDKGSASFMLDMLGREPKYSDAPRAVTPKAEAKKDAKKSGAPRMMSQFDSVEAFDEYLRGFDDEIRKIESPEKRAHKFYYYGNLFQSVIPYINQNPEYKKMLVEFFDKHQNPKTGVWSEVVCFDAVNGLHKIGAVYNSLGVRMKHIDKMVDLIMQVLAIPPEKDPCYCYIDIYNIWSCFPYLYANIMKCGDGDEQTRLAEKAAIKERIFASAAEGIRNSYNQVVGLRQADSAFSNRVGNTFATMGCPIAVPGVTEGSTASLYSLTHHIFLALEAQKYEVPMCTEYERTLFMDTLEGIRKRGPWPKKKADYRVVVNTPDSERVLACVEKLKSVVEVTEITTDKVPSQVREIVLGDAKRDGVENSKAKLEKALEGKPEGTRGFAITSIGRYSISYTDQDAMEKAVDYFVNHYPAAITVETFSEEE